MSPVRSFTVSLQDSLVMQKVKKIGHSSKKINHITIEIGGKTTTAKRIRFELLGRKTSPAKLDEKETGPTIIVIEIFTSEK